MSSNLSEKLCFYLACRSPQQFAAFLTAASSPLRMANIKEGDPAPAISLPTDSGQTFDLSSLKGKNIVLYFYPKADTPGCTTESCAFRDKVDTFTDANAVIVGVSPDTSQAQAKFKGKFSLPFTLLADSEHK